ncbi:hypothetical protein NT2_01_05510 [Caenibius tardaugens NBRC 16725]|uniref:DUF7064 domain-containing protein n=1 Tax=Caenibius tardaugens NBRC 16725 TaxID=1219035 RepID=U2YI92_9SPHN|nr:hypothetical protein [Caenibius tardaugens]AZI37003.1 hypothetical protein EGO55_14390 [Caenibius tardaugens NBRC 16725]GAD47777.1 hypothetical protein NT2_01_05510 [Caenibius tardaugens NBRC 16725]
MTDGFRLLPDDEYPHTPDQAINFNESVYSNAFDRDSGVGGWMRIGNRVNEGYAEKSVVLYLPDGRIACSFGRPPIDTNTRFEAEGQTFEVIEPFRHLRHSYRGEVLLLDDPQLLRDPARMMAQATRTEAEVVWDHRSANPLHGGEPLSAEQRTMYGRDFSRGHFNQHITTTGHIRVGDQQWPVTGHGWRDHSWGPRYWTNLFAYRLFLATFEDGKGLMLLKIFAPDGTARSEGALLIDGEYDEVMDLSVVTDWDERKDPRNVRIGVRTATRSVTIEADVRTVAPLRNRRRDGDVTLMSRIAEGLTRFRWDGQEAWGMTEYIERIEDGKPVLWPN